MLDTFAGQGDLAVRLSTRRLGFGAGSQSLYDGIRAGQPACLTTLHEPCTEHPAGPQGYQLKKPMYKRVWFWLLAIIEVFSPGFAVRGRLGEASLQVRPLCQRTVECRLPGARAEGSRPKSLTTRSSPDQRRQLPPLPGLGILVRKPH